MQGNRSFDWTDLKTIKQYRSMGEVLEEFRVYGFREGVENILSRDPVDLDGNGHKWLTLGPEVPEGL